MGTQDIKVSIIILTKNGEEYLGGVLESIYTQKVGFKYEVIIIDSGSRDSTLDIIKKFPIQLIQIPPESFNHGGTRNLGAKKARGEFIVFMNQDVTPVGSQWLQKLFKEIISQDVVAVYLKNLPRPGLNPLRKRELENDFPEQPRLQRLDDPKNFEALTNAEKRYACVFTTVCSIVKRSYFLEHPFKVIEFGEDVAWAREVLLNGKAIAYDPSNSVIHSHNFYRSPSQTFRLLYDDSKFLVKTFGKLFRTNPFSLILRFFGWCIRDVVYTWRQGISLPRKAFWTVFTPVARLSFMFGILAGYNYKMWPRWLENYFSSVSKKKKS
ncbi:MAG: glycosyltransferase family 2 protein [Patescibacteria group bacterium]|jgi:rhamnosyltransferase